MFKRTADTTWRKDKIPSNSAAADNVTINVPGAVYTKCIYSCFWRNFQGVVQIKILDPSHFKILHPPLTPDSLFQGANLLKDTIFRRRRGSRSLPRTECTYVTNQFLSVFLDVIQITARWLVNLCRSRSLPYRVI